MKNFSGTNDPIFIAKELKSIDRFFLKFIKDERDLPFVYLNLFLFFTLIPSTFLFYARITNGYVWYLHVAIHLLIVATQMGPFTLMLHNTSHRPFFKNEKLSGLIPWLIGPFMGQSPLLYYSHHIGMHHSEGNMPEDRSSTMPFQRDSLRGFAYYWFRFMTIGIVDLFLYFNTKNKKTRTHFQWMSFKGEFIFWSFCLAMCFINFYATLTVFILPVLFIRSFMMMGNWAQHAFVDQNEPDNDYKSSITCINSTYNKTCFNDGYHIGHHCNPNMHWTDMPGDFEKNKQKYIDNQSIVFEKLDYNQVWFYLMTKNYKQLAVHFVDLGNQFQNDEEIIALMKSRTQRFDLKRFEKIK